MTRDNKRGGSRRATVMPLVTTMLLLGGLTIDQRMLRAAPADASDYHAAVKRAAAQVPLHVGAWFAEDVPVPPAAIKLLRPNVIVSRRYTQMHTGQRVDFLLVQCADARDILGHYPPVCYVTHGWTRDLAQPRDWQLDDLHIPGTVYQFSTTRKGLPVRMLVYNFILLPDGQICRGMDEADDAAQDRRRKYFGAAQVQLLFDGDAELAASDEVLTLMVRANRELFRTIGRGTAERPGNTSPAKDER